MREPSTLEFLDAGVLDGMWYWDLGKPGPRMDEPDFLDEARP